MQAVSLGLGFLPEVHVLEPHGEARPVRGCCPHWDAMIHTAAASIPIPSYPFPSHFFFFPGRQPSKELVISPTCSWWLLFVAQSHTSYY